MDQGTQIAQWVCVAYVIGLSIAACLMLLRDRRLEDGDVSGAAFANVLTALNP
jgi:hypothetical protein